MLKIYEFILKKDMLNLMVYKHLFDLNTGVLINEKRERIEYLATVWTWVKQNLQKFPKPCVREISNIIIMFKTY